MNNLFSLVEAVVAGSMVFVLGQYILDFILRPMQQLRDQISHTDYILGYYANKLYRTDQDTEKIRLEFRSNAYELKRLVVLPHFYLLFHSILRLPNKNKVFDASKNLIGFSNTIGKKDPEDPKHHRESQIRDLLNLSA